MKRLWLVSDFVREQSRATQHSFVSGAHSLLNTARVAGRSEALIKSVDQNGDEFVDKDEFMDYMWSLREVIGPKARRDGRREKSLG